MSVQLTSIVCASRKAACQYIDMIPSDRKKPFRSIYKELYLNKQFSENPKFWLRIADAQKQAMQSISTRYIVRSLFTTADVERIYCVHGKRVTKQIIRNVTSPSLLLGNLENMFDFSKSPEGTVYWLNIVKEIR